MKRHHLTPRPNWRAQVEALGFTYHTHESGAYWDESTCYEFTAAEVDELEAAANSLHQLCIDAAEVVIQRGWWSRLGIPERAIPSIVASWERDDPSVYGRFDLAYDGVQPPKLLEYNADTPTALVEAAVVQWHWLRERFPTGDQFNSIHERLVEAWRHVGAERIHFAGVRDLPEDQQTLAYLADTCVQAGFKAQWLAIDDVGWDPNAKKFLDANNEPIEALFKLYPWEWLWHEPFAAQVQDAPTLFIEPAWKLMLSNKGLLPVLWELFPGHPNLLPRLRVARAVRGLFRNKGKLCEEAAAKSRGRKRRSDRRRKTAGRKRRRVRRRRIYLSGARADPGVRGQSPCVWGVDGKPRSLRAWGARRHAANYRKPQSFRSAPNELRLTPTQPSV